MNLVIMIAHFSCFSFCQSPSINFSSVLHDLASIVGTSLSLVSQFILLLVHCSSRLASSSNSLIRRSRSSSFCIIYTAKSAGEDNTIPVKVVHADTGAPTCIQGYMHMRTHSLAHTRTHARTHLGKSHSDSVTQFHPRKRLQRREKFDMVQTANTHFI